MTYTGMELVMNSLKQLINSNGNPVVDNNELISQATPQLILLYKKLNSMIQTLFVDNVHNLEKVRDMRKRLKEAAEEAHDIIDLFVSVCVVADMRNTGHKVFPSSLNLEDVMISIKSIEVDWTKINNININNNMILDSSDRESAAGGTLKSSKEIIVGLDDDVRMIMKILLEGTEKRDVISILGMGGLGKTTLATKLFYDERVIDNFDVRGWVTLSETCTSRDILISVLESMHLQQDIKRAAYHQLDNILHSELNGQKYLIVIDNVQREEDWDRTIPFFRDFNNGSRILLTTRHTKVALHADAYIHRLQYLTEEESWDLLCRKVFHEDECPSSLIELGKQIAKNCHGLPLAVVIVAGQLENEAKSEVLWEKVASNVASYIKSNQAGYLAILALSYNQLPCHLRECFLYLVGFPENFKIPVRVLIWLWVAEGFVQEAENRNLEDIAEAYLMDLVDINLLVVEKMKPNGVVKAWKVHPIVKEICLEKAQEERFLLNSSLSQPPRLSKPYKQHRMFINQDICISNRLDPPIRSLLHFHNSTPLVYGRENFPSYVLLRVLHLDNCQLNDFPPVMASLIHLRYLAIWNQLGFPPSICNLWSLQTLIVKTSASSLKLPNNISDLVNLRHLWSDKDLSLLSLGKPMNLQTISNVELREGIKSFREWFPKIKKFSSTLYSYEECDFLPSDLETLKLT